MLDAEASFPAVAELAFFFRWSQEKSKKNFNIHKMDTVKVDFSAFSILIVFFCFTKFEFILENNFFGVEAVPSPALATP